MVSAQGLLDFRIEMPIKLDLLTSRHGQHRAERRF